MAVERGGARLRGLYAITPEERDNEKLFAKVRAALEGGARLVQYRVKSLPREDQRIQARRLVALCRDFGVPLIVNDSIEIALESDADGVHIGRDDGDARDARRRIGDRILGVSCYDDARRAREAAAAGADYVGIGSVFASSTKPGAVRAPLTLLAEAKQASGLPVAAIGGITQANAREAIEAGADMLAVIAAVFDAPDVRSAAHEIARCFEPNRKESGDVRAQPRAV